MKLKDCKLVVRKILHNVPSARDDDHILIEELIKEHCKQYLVRDTHGEVFINLKSLKHLPKFETIRRSRQIIQNTNGEYLPTTEAVRKSRKIKEQNWRDAEVREANKI